MCFKCYKEEEFNLLSDWTATKPDENQLCSCHQVEQVFQYFKTNSPWDTSTNIRRQFSVCSVESCACSI